MVVYAQDVKRWDKVHSDIFPQESLIKEIYSLTRYWLVNRLQIIIVRDTNEIFIL